MTATAPRTLTPGQMKDLASALVQAIPSDLPFEVAEELLKNKGDLGDEVRKILLRNVSYYPTLPWYRVYKLIGMTDGFRAFITEKGGIVQQEGLWTLPVLEGLTCSKVIQAMRNLGVDIRCRDDIDDVITIDDRDPNRDGSYVVSFKANREADEDTKNLSANELKEHGHEGITVLERLLLELFYFLDGKERKHLDQKEWTMCSGSRLSDGNVPIIHRNNFYRYVFVHSCTLDHSHHSIRSRSVVSSASAS